MPTVGELKTRARALEQEGEWAKALAVYQHVLNHLERAPEALVKELALYVKVGDLRVRMRQPARAVESYERAADHYAQLGSAQRVTALCTKIVRVVPADAKAFARYARKLLEHGHVRAARDVLGEFADLADLEEAASALDNLAGRPEDEIRPMLEGLVDSIERDKPDQTETAAARVSVQLSEATDALAGDVPAIGDEDLPATPPELKRPVPEPTPAPTADVAPAGSATKSAGPDSGWTRPAGRTAQDPGPAQTRRSKAPILMVVVAFVVGIGGGVALAMTGLMPTGRQGDGESTPEAEAPVAEFVEPVTADSMPDEEGGTESANEPMALATDAADSPSADDTPDRAAAPAVPEVTAPVDTAANVVAADTAASQPADEDSVIDVPATPTALSVPDSFPTIPDTVAQLSTLLDSVTPDPVADDLQPIVVDGLAIQSVTEIEFRGQSGYRVIHLLDSGLPFTVESFPTPGDTAGLQSIGRVIVGTSPPDTVVGVLRMERHMVYASGVLPEDSLRTLMGLLRERQPSN